MINLSISDRGQTVLGAARARSGTHAPKADGTTDKTDASCMKKRRLGGTGLFRKNFAVPVRIYILYETLTCAAAASGLCRGL